MNELSEKEMLDLIKQRVKAFPTKVSAASYFNVHPPYLCRILAGKRVVGKTIPRQLGFETVIVYRKKENPHS